MHTGYVRRQDPAPRRNRRRSSNTKAAGMTSIDNSGAVISYPEYLGTETFVMHDTGSAW